MQKPIYLLFSGARQLFFVHRVSCAGYFLVNCYRAREGNTREEERSLLSFSPQMRARVLEFPPMP